MNLSQKLFGKATSNIVLLCEIPITDEEYDVLTDYAYEKMTDR